MISSSNHQMVELSNYSVFQFNLLDLLVPKLSWMRIKITYPVVIFLLLISNITFSQSFWIENWLGCSCAQSCTTYTGPNGAWSVAATGTNGAAANEWYFSYEEQAMGQGQCGSASGTKATAHIGNVSTSPAAALFCPTGDCGAAYDAANGAPSVVTNTRLQSPVINCTGKSNIELSFNYIMGGEAGADYGTVYYYDGTTWASIVTPPVTVVCGGGQGKWANYKVTLPASANNNAAVQVGFNWQNDANNSGNDPSLAIDSIQLITLSAPPVTYFTANDSVICQGTTIQFTDKSTNSPTSWNWTFNGGTPATSTAQNPTVTYNTAGLYSVTEVATNSGGSDTLTKKNYIRVSSLPVVSILGGRIVCGGSSTKLTVGFGSSYTWAPATGLNVTTGNTVIATPTVTTQYTVTATSARGCVATDTATISVVSSIKASITGVDSLCKGSTTILTATGGSNYTWNTGATSASINISPVTATTYSVMATAGTCKDSATKTVNIKQGPKPIITGNDSVCAGSPTTLTSSYGSSYNWNTGATTSSVTVSPTSTTIYQVTVDSNGCLKDTSVTVIVGAVPSLTVTPTSATICGVDTARISVASTASSYSWSPAAGLNVTTGNLVLASPTVTTTYTVIGKTPYGCTDTSTITVTVNNSITAGITGKDSVCKGSSTTLTGTGGNTYSWNTGATSDSISASPASTATYTVYARTGGCKDSAEVTVKVNPMPSPFIGGKDSVCAGGSTTLTASGGGTYLWNTGATSANIFVTPVSNTTYTVTVTLNGCVSDTTAVVSVNAIPTVTVTPSSGAVCGADSVILSASGASSYVWNPATGLNTSTGSPVTATPTVNTTYTVTGTTGSGCSNTATAVITVGSVSASISGTDSICSGNSTILTASGGANYLWNTGSTSSALNVSPAVATTYTVYVNSGSCNDSATVTVKVNPNPVVVNSPADTTICAGASVTCGTSAGVQYVWSNGQTSSSIIVTPASTTTYTATVTNAYGCSGSAQTIVNVTNYPVPVVSGTQNICTGNLALLTASGGTTYSWSGGSTTSAILVNTAGTYTVTIANGNCAVTDSVKVIVNPRPYISACCDTTIDIGESTALAGLSTDVATWTPATGLSCTYCPNPIATPTVNTTYYATVTDNTTGCSATDSVTILVRENCQNVFVPSAFSPNGDGQNDVLLVKGECIKTMDFEVFDRWGNKVFETTTPSEGWNGMHDGQAMNTGSYVYHLTATLFNNTTVTKKGNVTLVR